MSIANKLIYLNGTKEKLKDSINNIGGSITDETTFRAYATELDNIYSNIPKTTGEGSNLSLSTIKGRINVDDILGDTEQDSTTGYNLLDESTLRQGAFNSETGTTRIFFNSNYYLPAGTYTFDSNLDMTKFRYTINVASSQFPTNSIDVFNSNWLTSYSHSTFTTTTGGYLGIGISKMSDGTANITPSEVSGYWFMVYSGSYNSSKPYEKYTGGQASPNPTYPQDIEVVTGQQEVVVSNKNLYKSYSFSKTTGGITFTYDTSGSITATGTATATATSMSLAEGLEHLFTLPSGTYTISGASSNIFVQALDSSGTELAITNASTLYKSFTISEETEVFLRYRVPSGTDLSSGETIYPMLELGSTSTSYVEHQEQTKTLHLGDIELAKIGTYQDRIYKNSDKWYIEKNIGKVIFNGSENWLTSSFGTNSYSYNIADMLKSASSGSPNYVLTNLFRGVPYDDRTISGNNIAYSDQTTGLFIRNTEITSLANFKSLLSTTNLITYYVLATPTYTEITNTTLLNELNELEKIMSYNGTTNISISGNLPMILNVSALKGE